MTEHRVDPDDHDLEEQPDHFQYMLLCYLNSNMTIWNKCSLVLKDEYFTPDYRKIFICIKKFFFKNNSLPDSVYVLGETGIQLVTPRDADRTSMIEEICRRCEEWCRRRATELFLLEVTQNIDKVEQREFVAEMTKKIENISNISINLNLGNEIHEDIDTILERNKVYDMQKTGFRFLDEIIGGLTMNSYNLVTAPSGKGKSVFLQNIALNYAEMGHNVVYITLELSEYLIMKRMAAMMAGVPIKEIYKDRSIIASIKSRDEGKIQIIRFPMSGTTPAILEGYVRELENNTNEIWNHIIIDYPDLLYPNEQVPYDNIHIRDKLVSASLYDWAHDKDSPKIIWGASQQTKDTEVDDKKSSASQIAGGADKVRAADVIISARRNEEDMMRNIVWYHVTKGRNGGDGARIPMYWCPSTLRITCPDDLEPLFVRENRAYLGHKPYSVIQKANTLTSRFKSPSNTNSAGHILQELVKTRKSRN